MTTLAPFRAVSTLILKSVDDDQRTIEGVASSAATDASGDILEPRGASYQLPMPLLMQHDRNRPVGEVRSVKVTDSAIHIRARIAKDSGLAYVEDAWRQLKAGLVKGLSIGAHPLKAEPILNKDGRMTGVRYTAWRWLELSAVTLPMNSDASIEMVRAFDPWGAEAFAAHYEQLIDSIGPAAELAAALEPLVLEVEAVRDEFALLKVLASDHSYEATRARAEAALVASRQVLRSIEARHGGPSRQSDQAVRARAEAALNLSATVQTRARAIAALKASAAPDYDATRARAVAVLEYSRRVSTEPARHQAYAALEASRRALEASDSGRHALTRARAVAALDRR